VDTSSQLFNKYNKAIIALSGGADSAAVLMLAAEYMGAENVLAATCVNNHVFSYEIRIAEDICKKLGVKHHKFQVDPVEGFVRNGDDRCYHCKKSIMAAIKNIEGYDVIFDGTSVDDKEDDRPGSKAIKELDIKSPLKLLGYGKKEALEIVSPLNIKFYDESCKATRLINPITDIRMDKVEELEDALREILPNMRYRIDQNLIELKKPLKLKVKGFERINEAIRRICNTSGHTS
jgi:uncharacterized protein